MGNTTIEYFMVKGNLSCRTRCYDTFKAPLSLGWRVHRMGGQDSEKLVKITILELQEIDRALRLVESRLPLEEFGDASQLFDVVYGTLAKLSEGLGDG